MSTRPSRRQFLKHSVAAGAALSFSAVSWSRVYGANSKVRIASVGTGGKGWSDLVASATSDGRR